jgi:formylmethanofuran dehydrogenase subunit B
VSPSSTVAPVTCLGCGCGCDDLVVEVSGGRIVNVSPPCPVARAWFGDGRVPTAIRRSGKDATLKAAIADAAEVLSGATGRALVVLAPEVSVQAQRAALALADLLRATVETVTSVPAAAGLLAAQRRGRTAATLGEVRNRADALLFWGVDPGGRYPRYWSRYGPEPAGTHVPDGRTGRTVFAVSIGRDRGPPGADVELALSPDEEIPALSVMRAVALGNSLGPLPPPLQEAADIALRLTKARYAVVIHEAEPGAEEARDGYRAEGLLGLAEALNGPTRAALSSLRAGGNRSGAEAALTWQTGYPMGVTFQPGYPQYAAARRGISLAAGAAAAILVVGAVGALGDGDGLAAAAGRVPVVVVGPRASEAAFPVRVAVDTGLAGIHEGGTAYRMDEVPLPLRPPLAADRTAVDVCAALLAAIRARNAGGRT